jgi:hypothetical protein
MISRIRNSPRRILLVRNISNFFYIFQDFLILLNILITHMGKHSHIANKPLKIVTASDTSHFLSVVQLINSIKKYDNNSEIVFYDLGLKKNEFDILKKMQIKIIQFPFQNFPNFMNLSEKDAGAYAWKPQIIISEISKDNMLTLWLDAGDLVNKNLNLVRLLLHKKGFYSPLSNGYVGQWTHGDTLEALSIKNKIKNKRMLNAAIIGINPSNKKIKSYIKTWSEYAMDKKIILPEGSGKNNHRWDQSLLTVLYYKNIKRIKFPKTHKIFGILTHQDVE